jgi:tetratricopeptide (TPR) repeat protein
MLVAAFGLLLMLAEPAVSQAYFEINTSYARACAQGAASAKAGAAVDQAALAACTASVSTEPLSPLGMAQTLTNRGVIKFVANDRAGAFADFSAALKQQKDFAPAYLNRAAIHMAAERYNEALADADRAVQLDNTNARAWLMRGGANELLGRTTQAYKDYQAAARADPSWDRPKAELARFTVKK